MRIALAALALCSAAPTGATDVVGLDRMLRHLMDERRFSGAVVVRRADRVEFASGYGPADPFAGRAFTPSTPVDSGSIAKPVTAAAILVLVREGRIGLDRPVRLYLPEFPYESTTVRHLLTHSAGLSLEESPEALAGKSNAALLEEVRARGTAPLFAPGSRFDYCNLCYIALAMLVERVSGEQYLDFARRRLELPVTVSIRPLRVADWAGRAIGYRWTSSGTIERFDSWDGEAFYGSGNFSLSAHDLALWGSKWWQPPLRAIRRMATAPSPIAGNRSGLTIGNWYCAPSSERCHYLGHHEGFHHMLYWDAARRVSVGMVTNNALSPTIQQRLQRAIVAFAENRSADAARELSAPLPERPIAPGTYRLGLGETVAVIAEGDRRSVRRRGVNYGAYPIGSGIRYVPGLDVYLAGDASGRLRWLSLYEDFTAAPVRR